MKSRQIKLKLAALSAACASLAAPMLAQAGNGPYIGVEGGANWQAPQNFDFGGGVDATAKFKHPFDAGYIGGLTFGYGTAIGLRPELELDYRRNDIKSFAGASISGYENAYTAMGNLWYDIKTPTGFFSVVHPYFGGGVGGARFAVRNTPGNNDFSTKFAYQGGAGLGFDNNHPVRPQEIYDLPQSLIYGQRFAPPPLSGVFCPMPAAVLRPRVGGGYKW